MLESLLNKPKPGSEPGDELKEKVKQTQKTAANLEAQAAGAKAARSEMDVSSIITGAHGPINTILELIQLPKGCLGSLTK